jgi:hypothetical protein
MKRLNVRPDHSRPSIRALPVQCARISLRNAAAAYLQDSGVSLGLGSDATAVRRRALLHIVVGGHGKND